MRLFHTNARAARRVLVQAAEPLIVMVASTAVAVLLPRLFRVRWGYLLPLVVLLAGLLLFGPSLTSASGMRLPAFYAVTAALFFASRLVAPARVWGASVMGRRGRVLPFAIGHNLLQLLAIPFAPRPPPQALIAQQVERLKPAHIYVDEFALNAVYNYNLPPNGGDYYYSPAGISSFPTPGEFRPTAFWFFRKQTVIYLDGHGLGASFVRTPILFSPVFLLLDGGKSVRLRPDARRP
ncbi:MAG: hypothetical protein WDO13_05070 [Verrucomicrobiota bacterium]